jgi:catechol 2,3-dioxygenase
MNTEIIVHPKLQHFGLTTANLDAMIDWYRKVLGMTVNHRSLEPTGAQKEPSLSAAWLSNDEVNHRIAFVELSGLTVDPEKTRHARLQHIAFEYETIDDLLGTYARLKGLGILPVLAADQGLQTALYYADPDQNSVELNVNNYGNEWTATEHIKTSPSFAARPMGAYVDPDKIIAARKGGASPWELHERAFAGEFVPPQPYDPRVLL